MIDWHMTSHDRLRIECLNLILTLVARRGRWISGRRWFSYIRDEDEYNHPSTQRQYERYKELMRSIGIIYHTDAAGQHYTIDRIDRNIYFPKHNVSTKGRVYRCWNMVVDASIGHSLTKVSDLSSYYGVTNRVIYHDLGVLMMCGANDSYPADMIDYDTEDEDGTYHVLVPPYIKKNIQILAAPNYLEAA